MLRYEGMLTRQETIDALSKILRANEMTDGVHIRLTVTRRLKYTSGLEPRVNVRGCSLIILAEHKNHPFTSAGASVWRPFGSADLLPTKFSAPGGWAKSSP